MNTAERLTKILKNRGILQREAAAVMGVTRQAVGRYLNGLVNPPKDKIEKLAAFLNVSPSYLLFGENEPDFENFDSTDASIQISSLDPSESVRMLRVKKEWISFLSLNPKFTSLRIISIAGDNMKPTINQGDITVVDTSVNTIQAEGIYVIEANGQKLIKRAQRKLNGGLLLIDDNSHYCHTSLSKEDAENVKVIGKCIFAFKTQEL